MNHMKSQELNKFKLPDTPGVYLFKKSGKVLYVGKAGSLRDRVRSYFSADLIETRGPRIVDMVTKANGVSFRQTDSVLEALLLEAELIKKLKPFYNTEGKDDKSFNCVAITDEDFPRVIIIRQKDIDFSKLTTSNLQLKTIYGPFPHGAELREALKIIRRIFPYRDTCSPPNIRLNDSLYSDVLENIRIGKPCFNRQIGLCPGVCTGELSKKEYARTIKWLTMFFEGKKPGLIKTLDQEMKRFAKTEAFEQAGEIKRRIFALKHIKDVSLLKERTFEKTKPAFFRMEAFDISHTAGRETVGVMAVIENGAPNKNDYRLFNIKTASSGSDTGALKEILERRLRHEEWRLPNLIVVDGGKQQLSVARALIKKTLTLSDDIPVVSVLKNKYHKPKEILGNRDFIKGKEKEILLANAMAHRFAISFHRFKRQKNFQTPPHLNS